MPSGRKQPVGHPPKDGMDVNVRMLSELMLDHLSRREPTPNQTMPVQYRNRQTRHRPTLVEQLTRHVLAGLPITIGEPWKEYWNLPLAMLPAGAWQSPWLLPMLRAIGRVLCRLLGPYPWVRHLFHPPAWLLHQQTYRLQYHGHASRR